MPLLILPWISFACGHQVPQKTRIVPKVSKAVIEPIKGKKDLQELRKSGNYFEAFRLLQTKSELSRAEKVQLLELGLLLGRHEETLSICEGDLTATCSLLRAQVYRDLGLYQKAEQNLALPFSESEKELKRSLLLADILEATGQRERSKKLYQTSLRLSQELTQKKPQIFAQYQGEILAHLGLVAQANESYDKAEQAGDQSLSLLSKRAELYLNYRAYAQAKLVIEEALDKEPEHPALLFLNVRYAFEGKYSYPEAEAHLRKVFRVDPSHVGARAYQAQLFLRQAQAKSARKSLSLIIESRRQGVEVLATQAALYFFEDDQERFKASLKKIEMNYPQSSRGYLVTAKIADARLRYRESAQLLKKAIRRDRNNAALHAQLGINLIRSGNEARGLVSLQRAHELQPFDVRVVNLLNLFEQNIRTSYSEEKIAGVHYRWPRSDAPILRRYLPGLMKQAQTQMEASYGFRLKEELKVEIYATEPEFAVRTSGLPQTSISGVCFGLKIATMSPRATNANLGMTLWHEMAHVYHLSLSEYRVPRFFSEGLAEWETARLNRGWQREMDQRLYRALKKGRVPQLSSMPRSFTHAESFEDVAIAYYTSGKIAEWLSARKGNDSPKKILQALAEHQEFNQVLTIIFSEEKEMIDEEFRSYLKNQVRGYEGQNFLSLHLESQGRLSLRPRLSRYVDLLVQADHLKFNSLQSEFATFSELTIWERLFLAQVSLRHNEVKFAIEQLELAQKLGPPSFETEYLLGQALLKSDVDSREAYQALKRAHELDPTHREVLKKLALYDSANLLATQEETLEYSRKWAAVAEDDVQAQEVFLDQLTQSLVALQQGPTSDEALVKSSSRELSEVAQWRVWSNLLSPSLHLAAAKAWLVLRNLNQAQFELKSALMASQLSASSSEERQLVLLSEWLHFAQQQNSQAALRWGRAEINKIEQQRPN